MSDNKKVIEQLEKLAEELYLNENKIYTAAQLVPRFKQAADRNRQDLTINQTAFVLEKIAMSNPNREISSKDLKKIAYEFYMNGTNFANEFADLLEEQKNVDQMLSNRIDYQGETRNVQWDGAHQVQSDLYEEDSNSFVDSTIACSKEELMIIRHAAMMIDDEMKSTGKVSKVSSVLRQKTPNQLFFQTTIRTANSESEAQVFVPVELKNEIPLFPQVMTTTEKVYELNADGIEQLTLDINASINLKRAQHISNLRSPEDYHIALRDDTIGQDIVEVHEFDDYNKEVSLGHDEIEQVLRDAVVQNDSNYTIEARNAGRELVTAELSDLGFKNPQVKFNGDYQHGLTYKASINTEVGKLDIIVPVENNKSILLPPSQFAVNQTDQVHSLTKDAINNVAKQTKLAKPIIHPVLFSMSYPELKKQLKQAAVTKKPKLAQQIISLIDEKFGDYYRNAAIDDYQTWLEESMTSYQDRCGNCNYYIPKTSQANQDYCNLVKTATKDVKKDDDTEICIRSTYAGSDESVFFDSGTSIKINWDEE